MLDSSAAPESTGCAKTMGFLDDWFEEERKDVAVIPHFPS